MGKLGLQEIRGAIGEARTLELLLDRFMVMKRVPDIDGTDYLVQSAVNSLEELRARHERIEVFGIVQSKFVQGANEVKIPRSYVEDECGARTDYFLLIHADDAGEQVDYFFGAQQIVDETDFSLRRNEKGDEEFVFSRASNRAYERYRNRPRREILDTIEDAIRQTEAARNARFITQVLATTISPSKMGPGTTQYIEGGNLAYVPHACDECRIPHSGIEYILRQVGETIRIEKFSPLTNTTASLGEYSGKLGNVSFDPISETVRTLPYSDRQSHPR